MWKIHWTSNHQQYSPFINVMNNISKYNNIKQTKRTASSPITVALAGNPNSGKTTLFNALTGSNQQVGNWPGVTVERKTGVCKVNPKVLLTDTPGCYSLAPFTPEEKIASDYLRDGKPNVILNVVDSTNLERNLMLTTQLTELGIPVVVALNMQDEARAKGITINGKALAKVFGCTFVPVSATKKEGIEELVDACVRAAGNTPPVPPRNANAHQRYAKIEQAIKLSVGTTKKDVLALTDKIDKIVLNKWLAFPLFAVVMTAVFFVSVGGLGGWLTDLIEEKLTPLLQFAAQIALEDAKPWVTSLVCDGIIGGVMSVVGFVPQVTILFGCIALLEGCGYMSRIAFVTDRLLHSLGLSGRSFVCMILGCGCSVPAIMSTRTIKDERERNTTVTLAPFVPCSAKLAVIAYFTSYAFDGNALFAVSFYFASIAVIIIGGFLLKLFQRDKKENDVFLMELPPYRLPRAKNVLRQMWQRCKSFLVKAGTVIFAASVILWVLTHLDIHFALTSTENSLLALLGKTITPLFAPLGFDDCGCGWQLSVAALSGIAAKETVVTTLQMLLPNGIANAVSPLGAYCFVLHNLFTIPCLAACSASFAEQGNWKRGLKSAVFQIVLAYALTLTVYQTGRLLLKL